MHETMSSLAKVINKDMIREVKTSRIIPCLSNQVPDLKGQAVSYLRFPAAVGLVAAAMCQSRQASLGEINDDLKIEDISSSDDDSISNSITKIGLIYGRVSSDAQVEDGESLDAQLEELQDVADDSGIELPYDPILDEGKTGTDFNRTGIRDVFRKAKAGEFTHLLVDDVSRIGRSAPETLYFIFLLTDKFGIKILTTDGPLHFQRVEGLVKTTFDTLMSHISVKERGRKSMRSKKRRFVEQENYLAIKQVVPLGYRQHERGWIEVEQDEVAIVEDMFDIFVSERNYSATASRLNERYSEQLESKLAYQRVKVLLQDRVYIGEPTIYLDSNSGDSETESVEDPDLEIIDQSTFEQAQRLVEEKSKSASKDNDDLDLEGLTDLFGLVDLLDTSPYVILHCPECFGRMVQNGTRDLRNSERRSINYICKECERQKKFPNTKEIEQLRFQSESGPSGASV